MFTEGLDREDQRGYMSGLRAADLQTFSPPCRTSEESLAISGASVGNGVTVAQQTLTLFVLVRIQVPQPVPGSFPKVSSVSVRRLAGRSVPWPVDTRDGLPHPEIASRRRIAAFFIVLGPHNPRRD